VNRREEKAEKKSATEYISKEEMAKLNPFDGLNRHDKTDKTGTKADFPLGGKVTGVNWSNGYVQNNAESHGHKNDEG